MEMETKWEYKKLPDLLLLDMRTPIILNRKDRDISLPKNVVITNMAVSVQILNDIQKAS